MGTKMPKHNRGKTPPSDYKNGCVAALGRHAGHADRRLDLTAGRRTVCLGPSDVSRSAGGVPGMRARHLL